MKTPLIVLELVLVAVFAAQLYYFPKQGIDDPECADMIALLVPPFGAWICFFPLCYYAWFRKPLGVRVRFFRHLFFWAIVLVAVLIWFNIIVMVVGWCAHP